MLADNEFVMDKRIHREAKALSDAGYRLTLYAVQRNDLPERETLNGIDVHRAYTMDIFDVKAVGYHKRVAEQIARAAPHVVHCHDWVTLRIGAMVKKMLPNVVLIYDSHELLCGWPIHYSSRRLSILFKTWLVRRYEIARERRDARHVDHLITVSGSIADYLHRYLKLKNTPTVVRNFAELEPVTQREDFVRRAFGIPTATRVAVVFALLIYRKKRNLEAVIDQLGNMADTALVIFCKEGGHKPYFVERVRQAGLRNVFFHDAIASDKIVNYLASCDVGVVTTWNKKDLSYWLGLENKLFHYVMSGLPVLASAQPEHKRIVEGFDIGVCVNGDEANGYKTGLQALLSNYETYKRNVAAARQQLCWEKEKQSLLDLYTRVAAAMR